MWDPDTIWVGNEGGAAGVKNTNVRTDVSEYVNIHGEAETQRFLPTECDFMMRDRNWFYSEYDIHTAKSLDELVGLYYHSVGCGSNFLINIGPDRRGLLPDVDAMRLLNFGKEISKRFSNPVPSKIQIEEDGIIIKLEKEQMINHLILAEDLAYGEMIEEFEVYIKNAIIYRPVCVYTGKTVGHKRIITFPQIRTTEIIVKIAKSRGEFKITSAKTFLIGAGNDANN